MNSIVKVLKVNNLTHDVLQIVTEKPTGLEYQPGQACDVSINKVGWENELRAFTFTSVPQDNFLEFNIKVYPSHNGVTNELSKLKAGDELIVGEVFGDIHYKGEGIFIAGGAGITPFLSILKDLKANSSLGNNKLIFANKSKADIISESILMEMLGKNFINVLSEEKIEGYYNGFITKEIIENQIDSHKFFYLCGPPPMMSAVEKELESLGVKSEYLIKEPF
jgi:ferredoxin-NADP reductase